MTKHLLLPTITLEQIEPREEYRAWLLDWLRQTEEEINRESVAASMCLQGAITELVLFKKLQTDWIGILEDLLTNDEGQPLAYSKEFGKKLYGFDAQWLQTSVHAVHTRFWIESLHGSLASAAEKWARLIESFIQPNGWIYNPRVSPTQLRTRMKSEYLMSFAMGIEILHGANLLARHQTNFEATLADTSFTRYLSAEHFRLCSLEVLNALHLVPQLLCGVLTICEAGQGYCDFSVADKIDDYMGTAKRTSRDVALHSPMSGLHAYHIAINCGPDILPSVTARLKAFYQHMKADPFDIRAFSIRDIPIAFGTDLSPIELVAASADTQIQL